MTTAYPNEQCSSESLIHARENARHQPGCPSVEQRKPEPPSNLSDDRNDHKDDGENDEDVDETSQDVEPEPAHQPKNEEYYGNCPEHTPVSCVQ